MKLNFLGFLAIALFSVFVFAQVPSPSPVLDGALGAVSHAVDQIPSAFPAWMIAILAAVAELCLRIFPTVQPKSIFIYAGSVCALLGAGLMKISGLIDQIVQNLKDPAPKA